MDIQEYKGIYVFIQQVDNKVAGVSHELLGKAKELAKKMDTEVTAVLLGYKVSDLCKDLSQAMVRIRLSWLTTKTLNFIRQSRMPTLSAKSLKNISLQLFLYGATAIGRDLAPRVAARVRTGLTADCTKLDVADDGTKNLRMTRPAFGGNIMATIICPDYRPQMATVRPGVMQKIKPIEGCKCSCR